MGWWYSLFGMTDADQVVRILHHVWVEVKVRGILLINLSEIMYKEVEMTLRSYLGSEKLPWPSIRAMGRLLMA